jgi:hypothetical protein
MGFFKLKMPFDSPLLWTSIFFCPFHFFFFVPGLALPFWRRRKRLACTRHFHVSSFLPAAGGASAREAERSSSWIYRIGQSSKRLIDLTR